MNIVINLQTLYDEKVLNKIEEFSKQEDISNIYVSSSLMHDVDGYIIDKINLIDKVIYIKTNTLFDYKSFLKVDFKLSKTVLKNNLSEINILSSKRWIPISYKDNYDELTFAMYMSYDIYNFWSNFFDKNNIDIVISLNDEHSSIDSILNKVAKEKNVSKIITCSIVGALAADGVEYFALYEHNEQKYIELSAFNGNLKKINIKNYDFQKFSIEYEESFINKYKFIYLQFSKIIFENITIKEKLKLFQSKLYRWLYVKIKFIQQVMYIKSLKKYYEKISILNINYNNKYVYYCLHFDPEATTLPKDGIYSNQLLNIRIISSSLSEGWKLYVKEHPHQLDSKLYKNIFLNQLHSVDMFRSKIFYDYIKSFKNVELISLQADHNKLIKNAQYIASNTGTVFREATSLKKRCITFSNKSIYLLMDNVYQVSDYYDCRKIFDEDNVPNFSSVDELFSDYTISINDLKKRDSILLDYIIKNKLYLQNKC